MKTEVLVTTRNRETIESFLSACSPWLCSSTHVQHKSDTSGVNFPTAWTQSVNDDTRAIENSIRLCKSPTLIIVGEARERSTTQNLVTKTQYRRRSLSMVLWWDKSRHSFPSMLSTGALPSSSPSPMRSPKTLVIAGIALALLSTSYQSSLFLVAGYLLSKITRPSTKSVLPTPRRIGTQGKDARASIFLEEKRIQIRTTTSSYLNFWIHPKFGWTHARIPVTGEQQIHSIQQDKTHKWCFRFDESGFRKPSTIQITKPRQGKRILWLGCSIAEGWGVDEKDWCVTLIQNQNPNWEITNRAVGNYSIYQMYLQLVEEIQRAPYDAVVACLHDGLTWRLSKYFRRFYRNRAQPVFDISDKSVTPRGTQKPQGPNSIDFSVPRNWRSEKTIKRERESNIAANLTLLENIKTKCDDKQTPVLFLGVDRFNDYKNALMQKDYHWTNAGVDRFDKKENGLKTWTLWPFDGHPNQEAHKRYASVGIEALRLIFDGKKIPHFDENPAETTSTAYQVPTDTYTLI